MTITISGQILTIEVGPDGTQSTLNAAQITSTHVGVNTPNNVWAHGGTREAAFPVDVNAIAFPADPLIEQWYVQVNTLDRQRPLVIYMGPDTVVGGISPTLNTQAGAEAVQAAIVAAIP